jgi:hypothetical protein
MNKMQIYNLIYAAIEFNDVKFYSSLVCVFLDGWMFAYIEHNFFHLPLIVSIHTHMLTWTAEAENFWLKIQKCYDNNERRQRPKKVNQVFTYAVLIFPFFIVFLIA